MKTYIYNKVAAVTNSTVPSDLQSGGAEGAHLQCAVDCKSTNSMPADYKSTGTFFRKAASALCTLCSVLLISSCTQDEITAPPAATDDVLATMDANTRVGIQAKITDNREQSTTTRAEGDESGTTYYAMKEIHPGKEVSFTMYIPGASDEYNAQLFPVDEQGARKNIAFSSLADTEPFSTLMLKDFNLTEGYDRCVSRWTLLNADFIGQDNLWGWARLTADATTGKPVLDYGEMKRTNAKVTIVVVDENGTAVDVADGKVSATLSLPWTLSDVIYTPEGETVGQSFVNYLNDITTLTKDEAIDTDRISIATYANEGTENEDISLYGMVTANDNSYYYGENNNTLAAIVPVTATHTPDDSYNIYTPIDNPTFTDADKLTITVNEDPDDMTAEGGTNGPQTTGTYSLKLKDIVVQEESGESGEESAESLNSHLSSFISGKHYTLTVTLRHNTLVSATATIGAWSEASASATLGGDDAKLPSYTYDAETNTYTVYEEAGIEDVLADMKENADRTNATVMMNGAAVTLAGDAASLNAWATAVSTAITNGTAQSNLLLTADINLPATTADGTAITVNDGVPSGSNWTPLGLEHGKEFIGTIDGRGHTISGLRISSTTSATGFIGWLGTDGVVKNLTLADAVVYSTLYNIGTVVAGNYGTVENCHVTSTSSVTTTSNQAGGIVGSNDYGGLLMGCTNAAAVSGTQSVGGIAGANGYGGIIIACSNTGAVTNTGNSNLSGYTYACWSTDSDDLGTNYGTNAGNYTLGTNMNAETLADAITAMNAAIDSYNAAEGTTVTCPYRWTAVEGEAYPVLTTSSNE